MLGKICFQRLENMYYSGLTDILLLLFVIVGSLMWGSKMLIEWRQQREDCIKTKAFAEAWHFRELIDQEGDQAYEQAKEKYNVKKEDEF